MQDIHATPCESSDIRCAPHGPNNSHLTYSLTAHIHPYTCKANWPLMYGQVDPLTTFQCIPLTYYICFFLYISQGIPTSGGTNPWAPMHTNL